MTDKKKYVYIILIILILVVSIIGATYAYLTANTNSSKNAVNTKSMSYNIKMDILPKYTGFTMIPMDNIDAIKAINNKCLDSYNRGACHVYLINISEYDETLEKISGTMNVTTNNIENLSYMFFESTEEYQEETCVKIDENNYCITKEATSINSGENLSLGPAYNVKGLESKSFLLLIWLENKDENQNEFDIGSFNASITFSMGDGSRIEGNIEASLKGDKLQSEE